MSLLMDTLKKMKREKKGKPVPPGLKTTEDNRKIRYIILGFITVLLSLSVILLYIFQDVFLYQENNLLTTSISRPNTEFTVQQKDNPTSTDKIPVEKKEKEKVVQEKKITNRAKIEKDLSPVKEHKETSEDKIKEKSENKKVDNSYLYSTYLSLANRYLEKEQYKKSLEYYKKAFNVMPSENLLKNIIILQIYTGEEDKAIKNLNKIQDDKILSDILLSLLEKGNIEVVRSFLEKNIKNRKSGDLYYVAGILQEKEGKLKDAFYYYKKAFNLKPSDPYIGYAYARLSEILGKHSLAVRIYRYLIQLPYTDNRLREIISERIRVLGGSDE
ncbi:hypothetical protein SAMN06265182_0233 [Persephonella hydrogeniphila]|uniref:Tetratricopeptide repeat-containing protein n=1 Tax=Persephonella hydrogeniphila TaxID=198703 RepID=A0A285N4G8_9AQUI|nr:hypothetical protein [Persephonella hydrogeniphila]SNZ02876.1 hypothetical protein SAMN06265182_0233 [Persephonella hydrogeniphila]